MNNQSPVSVKIKSVVEVQTPFGQNNHEVTLTVINASSIESALKNVQSLFHSEKPNTAPYQQQHNGFQGQNKEFQEYPGYPGAYQQPHQMFQGQNKPYQGGGYIDPNGHSHSINTPQESSMFNMITKLNSDVIDCKQRISVLEEAVCNIVAAGQKQDNTTSEQK